MGASQLLDASKVLRFPQPDRYDGPRAGASRLPARHMSERAGFRRKAKSGRSRKIAAQTKNPARALNRDPNLGRTNQNAQLCQYQD